MLRKSAILRKERRRCILNILRLLSWFPLNVSPSSANGLVKSVTVRRQFFFIPAFPDCTRPCLGFGPSLSPSRIPQNNPGLRFCVIAASVPHRQWNKRIVREGFRFCVVGAAEESTRNGLLFRAPSRFVGELWPTMMAEEMTTSWRKTRRKANGASISFRVDGVENPRRKDPQ
jgi:hypothetical protein